MKKLVSRMKVARVARGLTQEELAELTSLPVWRISMIENGLPPDRQQAKILSKALRLPISEIFPVHPYHELALHLYENYTPPWGTEEK